MVKQEGIRRTDSGLEFDWEKYQSNDIIPLKPVHKQFLTKKVSMFVAYAFMGINEFTRRNPDIPKDVAKEMIDQTRRELKYLSPSEVKNQVSRMIDESLNRFNSIHPINEFNLCISPKSSAPLNNLIMEKIKQKVGGGQPYIVPDAMVKNTIRNIKVNWDVVNREKSDKTKEMVPKYHQSLLNNPDELYAVKKVPASYRRYFIDFLKWSDGINPFWIYQSAHEGKILIIDDTVGEGATVQEMTRLLSKYNPNQIQVYSLFLDYGAGYDNLPTPKF